MTATNAQIVEPQDNEPAITPELGKEHGLSPDEYDLMLDIVGRTPSFTELGIFSVMWSEHCSYKSSRVWLAKLPTTGKQVIQGPGENAGIVDIGDGQAAVFKMESHNHPSFIEPYQGAATGVGGIMRDVFTMGARPIANLNALRFGEPDHPKTRHLVNGVVAGIAGYGNCMGVPTVGGETNFHPSYNGNILVNAMTVGLVETDRIFYSRGATPGNPVVYVGSKTGRDGIHGATMASAEFDDEAEAQRPTVQVGDPFTEKLLLEACLELMQKDAIICIQDMGAAGLTSSTVEIADKGGIGVELNLDDVPQREPGMTPYEIMLSESQERMLMVLKPGHEDEAREIFEKWELDFAVIGKTTDTGHLVLTMHGRTWCDIPVPPLVDKAPKYNRPTAPTPRRDDVALSEAPLGNANDTLLRLMASPDIASKRWIWEQYDSLVGGDTLIGPGTARSAGDAAVVRVREKEHKALAMAADCTPRYCEADPFEGGKQVVAESYRNITAVGAVPLAVTDNMNFGNPERPEIMGQFASCIEGMAEACTALDYPVVSGNVSLYNETNGQAILPTPTIGGVGLIKDVTRVMSMEFKAEGETILMIGQPEDSAGHIGQSLYLREIHGREDGPPPPVDLAAERLHGDFIRTLIQERLITACHDISDGGLLVALAEMAISVPLERREIGATLAIPEGADPAGYLYGEDQGRYVITTPTPGSIIARAKAGGVPVNVVGKTGGDTLTCCGQLEVAVATLRGAHENWLPAYMTGEDG